MSRRAALAVAVCAILGLAAACGGSADDAPTPTPEVGPTEQAAAVVVGKASPAPRQIGELGAQPYCLTVRDGDGTTERCLEVLFSLRRGIAPPAELQDVTEAIIRCWIDAKVGAPLPACWLR